jgi:hypothetical protein
LRPVKHTSFRLGEWLLEERIEQVEGPEAKERLSRKYPWWKVMCLTGVDYFSTLGYLPGIAALAAGALSPVATLFIMLLTLLGMLPMYRRVAAESPHGQGSIAMLERLLSFWKGKLFVLCLLGFVATSWLVTITLSASDATAHIVENPLVPDFFHGHEAALTLLLLALLAAIFLRGFREAIGLAVLLVAAYLALNLVVVGVGMYEIFTGGRELSEWWDALLMGQNGDPLRVLGIAALLFPQLALGLSGFETGVSMMPLVCGDEGDDPARPAGRIRNTRRLLTTAALVMCFYLLTTSFVTIVLIPAAEFREGGAANGRALAYVAHEYLGEVFGTVYDLSTVSILWFAGASAMAGLLNIVPRYLPRYGMAPEWALAIRPLVLVYTAVACVIVVTFDASVDAQAGAYATGVLAMMTSAAVAVALNSHHRGARWSALAFGFVTLIFVYATVENIVQRPDGLRIAAFFIVAIVFTSLVSRVYRSTELRTERIEIDATARRFIDEAACGEIHIIAHRRRNGTRSEYAAKEREQRAENRIPVGEAILFLEVGVADPSEFANVLEVQGVEVGEYRVLRAESSAVPNAIAAFLLYLRDTTGRRPHCYFGWSEGNPILYLLRFLLFGEGDTALVTHEVLREAEPDPERRPAIHVGGG